MRNFSTNTWPIHKCVIQHKPDTNIIPFINGVIGKKTPLYNKPRWCYPYLPINPNFQWYHPLSPVFSRIFRPRNYRGNGTRSHRRWRHVHGGDTHLSMEMPYKLQVIAFQLMEKIGGLGPLWFGYLDIPWKMSVWLGFLGIPGIRIPNHRAPNHHNYSH